MPCSTPVGNETGSTLTAAQAGGGIPSQDLAWQRPRDHDSPPSNPAIDTTDFYWVGRLTPQVDQTLVPKFTPSPFQLFLKAIIQIFDLLMNGIPRGEHRNGHIALSAIAGFLAHDGGATSWFVFNGWNTNEIAHALMSYGVCTLTLKGVNMRNYLTFFILGIEGVVRAMKEFCDFSGAVFAMDAHTPPVVSIYDIMNRAEEHAAPKRLDPELMNLTDYRIQMIINTLSVLEKDHDRVLLPQWWILDHEQLSAQPREMMKKVYFEKAEEDLLKLKHALEDREAAFQRRQEESAVNSANYSRRDDSIVTPPNPPGGQNPQNVMGSTVTDTPARACSHARY